MSKDFKTIETVDGPIDGPKYLLNEIQCSEKCPNNKYFNHSMQFAQFCTKCYNEISKKHKPVLKPRKLILPKDEEKAILNEKYPHSEYDVNFNLNSPTCNKKLNRQRCATCQKRLPLFYQKKNENDKFYCPEHFPP